VATSEPVVCHHGREGGAEDGDEARASAATACWAAQVDVQTKSFRRSRAPAMD
jgi:hypothetical protein